MTFSMVEHPVMYLVVVCVLALACGVLGAWIGGGGIGRLRTGRRNTNGTHRTRHRGGHDRSVQGPHEKRMQTSKSGAPHLEDAASSELTTSTGSVTSAPDNEAR